MSNPFAINNNLQVEQTAFRDTIIYQVRNVFADPYAAKAAILSQPLSYNKPTTKGKNGVWFNDCRHRFTTTCDDVIAIGTRLTGQQPLSPSTVITNHSLLFDNAHNDYQNNYWWPHIDLGYNGIVYLNDNYTGPGTNLYDRSNQEGWKRAKEHDQPWNPKDRWELIHVIDSEWNKLVLFDGAKFYHGMAVDDDTWFHQTRLNMVIFYKD